MTQDYAEAVQAARELPDEFLPPPPISPEILQWAEWIRSHYARDYALSPSLLGAKR